MALWFSPFLPPIVPSAIQPENAYKNIKAGSTLNYQDWLTYQFNYNDSKNRALGGLAVIIGLVIAFHRLRIATEEQMTNRFAKAVELLGNEEMPVKLGALYALERISNDSVKDYSSIIETIGAYIRSNKINSDNKSQEVHVREDINAAFNIIGRRKNKIIKPSLINSNLSLVRTLKNCNDFSEIEFKKSHFHKADLFKIDLSSCNLYRTKFTKENLNSANLQEAIIKKADFTFARLNGTLFQGVQGLEVDFSFTRGSHTYFSECALAKSNFFSAALDSPKFIDSYLAKANFKEADLDYADFSEAVLTECDFSGGSLIAAIFDYADVSKTIFTNANLSDVIFTNAKRLKWEQLKDTLTLDNVELPVDLLATAPDWYKEKYLTDYKNALKSKIIELSND